MKYQYKVKYMPTATGYNFTIQNRYDRYDQLIYNEDITTVPGITSTDQLTDTLNNYGVLYDNEILLKDQVSDVVNATLVNVAGTDQLTDTAKIDNYWIIIGDNTSLTAGDVVRIVSSSNYFSSYVHSISGDTIFTTEPLNATYTPGTTVTYGSDNVATDASGTTKIYQLRTAGSTFLGAIDITRLQFIVQTENGIELDNIGDMTALGYSILIRKKISDTEYNNILSFRSNLELAGNGYNFTPYDADNAGQGVNGFLCQVTFAGQGNFGVAIRLESWQDLEVVIHKGSTADITSFRVRAQGHKTNTVTLSSDSELGDTSEETVGLLTDPETGYYIYDEETGYVLLARL